MRSAGSSVLLLAALTLGCGGTEGSTSSKQAQPPVIVVQAPPDQATADAATRAGGEGAGSGYAGLAWQAVNTAKTGTAQAAGAEPYDVVALLREFDAQLTDPPNDQAGDGGHDDLLSALAVMDDKYLYGRVLTRTPMAGDNVREVRFWIEQQPAMVTVELKVGNRERSCELSDLKSPDKQESIDGCYWADNALDFRIPLDKMPSSIDVAKPYWLSGFQTCCKDEARNEPYDEIDGAQEVWRVPGLASEVESK
jgi:hypothetical protein